MEQEKPPKRKAEEIPSGKTEGYENDNILWARNDSKVENETPETTDRGRIDSDWNSNRGGGRKNEVNKKLYIQRHRKGS